jgi:hypothetical protein
MEPWRAVDAHNEGEVAQNETVEGLETSGHHFERNWIWIRIRISINVRSRIRIRIKVKRGIRTHINIIRIRNTSLSIII